MEGKQTYCWQVDLLAHKAGPETPAATRIYFSMSSEKALGIQVSSRKRTCQPLLIEGCQKMYIATNIKSVSKATAQKMICGYWRLSLTELFL